MAVSVSAWFRPAGGELDAAVVDGIHLGGLCVWTCWACVGIALGYTGAGWAAMVVGGV